MDHLTNSRLHIAAMLEQLLASGRVVLISKDDEHEYTASASPNRHSAASTLEGVIEELTDHPRRKVCLRPDCSSGGAPKPLWCFGADRDSADGHGGVCKNCEAKRIGGLSKRKKATA